MKKSTLWRLCLCFAVALFELPLMAQGVVVYKKDGTQVKFAYEEIDSIVTYNVGEDVEEDEPVVPPTTDSRAVDLGLSVKWASCNVGATSPEEYGAYYAWGETEEKTDYSWSTYKWCNGSSDTQTKYCTSSSYGTVDNKTTLDLEDDVAHVQWGGAWRMPSYAEVLELTSKCTKEWVIVNGIAGNKYTGPNGNHIFIPAAGWYSDGMIVSCGSDGACWTSSLHTGTNFYSHFMGFGANYWYWYNRRYLGITVRPVTE